MIKQLKQWGSGLAIYFDANEVNSLPHSLNYNCMNTLNTYCY